MNHCHLLAQTFISIFSFQMPFKALSVLFIRVCDLACGSQLVLLLLYISGVPRNFVRGGVQQIQLRTEDRENGNLGTVAP